MKMLKQVKDHWLKRRFERHSENKNILMLDDISDFYRFGKKGLPFIRQGFLCPFDPFTQDQLEEITEFAKEELKNPFIRFGNYEDYDYAPVYLSERWPKPLKEACDQMIDVFTHLVNCEPFAPQLRLNSTFPADMHDHPPALVYTFTGVATLCMNEDGSREFALPLRHIFVPNRGIYHRASDYTSDTKPKITLVL